ncbi:L-threonine 3-O-phosphate decarboxylase [Anaerovibrio sp. JC8]|uniref:threonine-phosphate decarboxylase CobD n=1 Tax=Anaerovibrio sp. JC8 TaxID=1240085 RepID=UPI000A0B061A|nr:threonine-phosphate decarboxylase CobD [Anaerovibrio sp. JC8]ORT99534.1 L-threonine 3-O-phosphate decarboxylase [Anaerovibrio sp. JC8]
MKPFEHGGNVYSAGVRNDEWLDFSANINPLGLSDSIKNSIIDNMESLVHYPDPTGTLLKQAISVHYGVEPDNIILGNGAVELMYIYFHTRQPRRVLIPVPSFSEYERGAKAAGCQIEMLYMDKEQGFVLDKARLLERLPDVDAVILGNPNNPTGELILRRDLLKILSKAKEAGTDIMVDESFLDFLATDKEYTVLDMIKDYPNLLVLRSMTKFFAVPGLRLGFGVANAELVQKMELSKDPWNVNLLAQMAGVAALKDKTYQMDSRQIITGCINYLYNALSAIDGLKVYAPSVNFILLSVEACGMTSSEFVQAMREKGILVRDCCNYPGMDQYHVRVAVRLMEENQKLVEAIKSLLAER